MADGTGCASSCSPGMIRCGGECIVGGPDSSCCIGPTGHGIACGSEAECCDGMCMARGTGCSRECADGLINCGGECMLGGPGSICCMGPRHQTYKGVMQQGIVCDPTDTCCDGICVVEGSGCVEDCGQGMKKCGGECLLGAPESTCCTGATGRGIICGEQSDCCNGICMEKGTGCSRHCTPFEVLCGGVCLPNHGNDGTCCVGAAGNGKVCGSGEQCCEGECIVDGTTCGGGNLESAPAEAHALHCPEGKISCGTSCLEGDASSICCHKSNGEGMLCGPSLDCCDSLTALEQLSKSNNMV